jgi:hypothetical protein
MGRLIEQSIRTLYQGVSRQPDPVRLPGQVEEADNVLVSIVTGGIESRPASRHISTLPFVSAGDKPAVYAYSRDTLEQYMIVINQGVLKVYDLEGIEKTVVFPDGTNYLDTAGKADEETFSFTTIADYTVIANNTKTVAMLPNDYQMPPRGLINCRTTNASTDYTISLTNTATEVTTQIWSKSITTALSNTQLATDVYNNLSLPTGYTKSKTGETIVITGGDDFTLSYTGSDDTYGPIAMTDSCPQREFLPFTAPDGYYLKVGANVEGELYGYWTKFVVDDGGWVETADPYADNEFDKDTMPFFLVREADGTFTFRKGDYVGRKAGDIETARDPDFVGNEIIAVAFHRNRLAFVAGENVSFSQSGEYFTFWADFSTQSLDSDSFGLTASSETVNDLRHAVGFRKSLFLTSNKAQFEVSAANTLTPSSASIDLSTSYLTEEKCKPITLGNTLYFAAKSGRDAVVYEYTYNDTQVSNVASDITLHALGYIPAPIIKMTGDSTTDTLMLLTDSDRSRLFVYNMYLDGDTKAQSSWSSWTYGDGSNIKWMQIIDGQLYMILSRDGEVFFERTYLRYRLEAEKHPYQVAMDRQFRSTGVFDANTGKTTWTCPYNHQDKARIVLSTDFPDGLVGETINVSYPDSTTVEADGDYSGGEAIIGWTFESSMLLSRIFPRDPNNLRLSLSSGRFQLRNMTFNFKDTGFFRVEVTPEFRDSSTHTFNGRIVGSGDSKIGIAAIAKLGAFKVPIKSDGKTVKIRVYNNTEKPMNLTSIDYVGFYNEITKQG